MASQGLWPKAVVWCLGDGWEEGRFYSAESLGLELGKDCTFQLRWEVEAEGS